MADMISWTVIMVGILALGAAGAAALIAAGFGVLERAVEEVEPRGRFAIVGGVTLFPIFCGFLLLVIAFYPSFLDLAGMVADHCRQHEGHTFHLCFLHFAPPSISWIWSAAAGVFVAWVGLNWSRELVAASRANRWSKRLMRLARFDEETSSFMVESARPLALTTGFFRRQIVLSERLRELLSVEQLEAVLAHERTHRKRFDALTTLLLRMAACFHFPFVRRQLLRVIEVTTEQICDEAAARKVGDPLIVAEAILAVERASGPSGMPRGVLCFGAHCVEKRVVGLLRKDWARPNWSMIAVVGAIVLGLGIMNLHSLHHLIEHALAGFF